MAHDGVWVRADESVIALQFDLRAPIAAQVEPAPECQNESGDRERNAAVDYGEAHGDEARGEDSRNAPVQQQPPGKSDDPDGEAGLPVGTGADRLFGDEGADGPDDEGSDPEPGDNFEDAGCGLHEVPGDFMPNPEWVWSISGSPVPALSVRSVVAQSRAWLTPAPSQDSRRITRRPD